SIPCFGTQADSTTQVLYRNQSAQMGASSSAGHEILRFPGVKEGLLFRPVCTRQTDSPMALCNFAY
ncbi:hypothetical protein, partial [Brevibacterium metallidurans]